MSPLLGHPDNAEKNTNLGDDFRCLPGRRSEIVYNKMSGLQKRTKEGNTSVLTSGVFAHFAIGAALFLLLLAVENLIGVMVLVEYQFYLAIAGTLAWIYSNIEKVPVNHCALKMWLGTRADPRNTGDEENDVAGEGWVLKWPFDLVTWFPYPTSNQVITIGDEKQPFRVQSGTFRVLDTNGKKSAIYLEVGLTVTLRISDYGILDFETLDKAENATVAVITSLLRDVVLKEEADDTVTDPAMVCERKDKIESEVDQRARGKYVPPVLKQGETEKPMDRIDVIGKHKDAFDLIGIEIVSIKVRKIDPDPAIIKAIENQKMEELSAKARGTEAQGVTDRIKKYQELGMGPQFAAVIDLVSEYLNTKKGKQ